MITGHHAFRAWARLGGTTDSKINPNSRMAVLLRRGKCCQLDVAVRDGHRDYARSEIRACLGAGVLPGGKVRIHRKKLVGHSIFFQGTLFLLYTLQYEDEPGRDHFSGG